ncbi:MAG: phosphatase PAP2 family protein [Ilumatobacteraceae bacterium]
MSGSPLAFPRVLAFDEWVDQRLESWRGNPLADFVFTNASHLGDFSVIWHIIGAARGLTSDTRADQAFVLSAALAAESLVVNQGIKRLFRRERPTETGDPRFHIRQPSTSSFPSGHASSAFVAATLLCGWSGKRSAPMWFGIAVIVAISRVYVRIHHASDIVGGAVVGLGLGAVARRVLRRGGTGLA